jgi:hypothetical protein
MLIAAVAFLIGAIFQAVNGPDLDAAAAWPFWFLAGLCAWALEAVIGDRVGLGRRRG